MNYNELIKYLLKYDCDNSNDNTKYWNYLSFSDINGESINTDTHEDIFLVTFCNYILEYYGSGLGGITYTIHIDKEKYCLTSKNSNEDPIYFSDFQLIINFFNDKLLENITETNEDENLINSFSIPNKCIPQFNAIYNINDFTWSLELAKESEEEYKEAEIFSKTLNDIVSELNLTCQFEHLNYKEKEKAYNILLPYFILEDCFDSEIKVFNLKFSIK